MWIDEAEINIGDSLITTLAAGIERADCVLAFISSNSASSAWVTKELEIAMTAEIVGRRLRVMPILLDRCEVPFFLIDKLYADFRDPDRLADEEQKLVRSVLTFDKASLTRPQPAALPTTHLDSNDDGDRVGVRVVDQTRGYRGYRVARMLRISGFAGFIASAFVFLIVYVGRVRLPIMFGVVSALTGLTGALYFIASFHFESAFDRDKRLLLEIERIGGYNLPFGKTWQAQHSAGSHNPTYLKGLYFETGATGVFYLLAAAMVVLVASLVASGAP